MKDNVIFSNFDGPKKGKNYMVFLGKEVSYLEFMGEAFRREGYEPVYIAATIAGNYLPNTIALDPNDGGEIRELSLDSYGLAERIARSRRVHEVIGMILDNQNELFVNAYLHTPELTLGDIDRVSVIAPDSSVAQYYRGKVNQREFLKDHLPMPPGEITDLGGLEKLFDHYDMGEGVFITEDYSNNGKGNAQVTDKRQIPLLFKKDCPYIIATWLPGVLCSPHAEGIVAGEDDVVTFGITIQRLDGTRFFGANYPTGLPEHINRQIIEYNTLVGKLLGSVGYRGIYGTDYMVHGELDVTFGEINPRKNGSTTSICGMMEVSRPKGMKSIPVMEMDAVIKGRMDHGIWEPPKGIHWVMEKHSYTGNRPVIVERSLPKTLSEYDVFSEGGVAFLNRLSAGTSFNNGMISRVISVGKSRNEAEMNCALAKKMVNESISYGDSSAAIA